MKTLVILASILGDRSNSRRLADHFIARLRQDDPGSVIRIRDLGAEPVPYFDGSTAGALFTPAEKRTPEQAALVGLSDTLVAELFEADRIVFAVPVYNFGMPAQLKSYIDYIARAGVTFRYNEQGLSEGLIRGKQVVILGARGGKAEGTPEDTLSPYLAQVLSFVGLADPIFIYAEGMAMGEASAQAGLDQARQRIDALLAAASAERLAA